MKKSRTKRIPNCLRKYRRMRELKQKDVAKILGVKSASMVSRWEKGVSQPSLANAFRLAAIYRTMVDGLFVDFMVQTKRDIHRREQRLSKNRKN